MFLPYSFDVEQDRRPWMAYVLVPLFVVLLAIDENPFGYNAMDFHAQYAFLSLLPWIQLTYLGILGFYLWVFGSAVCSKIGNTMFLVLLSGYALPLATVWNHDAHAGFMLGGFLLEGILGICLFLWPTNSVDCFVTLPLKVTFSIPFGWIVLAWFAFDVLLALMSEWTPALILLPLCLLGGVLFGGFLQWLRVAVMDSDDRTLWQILRREPEPDHTVNDLWATRKQKKPEKDAEPDLPMPAYKPPAQANDEFQVLCQCGNLVTVPRASGGKGIRCPHCNHPLRSI
jgi:hypothetical protein